MLIVLVENYVRPAEDRIVHIERIQPRAVSTTMSFLELEGLHVFVTGAAGGIGSAIVDEFLGRWNAVQLPLCHLAS